MAYYFRLYPRVSVFRQWPRCLQLTKTPPMSIRMHRIHIPRNLLWRCTSILQLFLPSRQNVVRSRTPARIAGRPARNATMLALVFVASNMASLIIASILRESQECVSREDLTSAKKKVCLTILLLSYFVALIFLVAGGNANQDKKEPIQKPSAAPAILPRAPHAEHSNICAFCPPFGYPEHFYNRYPPAAPPAESVNVCTQVAQPYFLASVPEFQPYLHPVQCPDSEYVHPPQAYYTYVFPSVSYHPGQ